MKRLAACLLGVCLCAPAYAQWKFLRLGKKSAASAREAAKLSARVEAGIRRAAPKRLSVDKVRALAATPKTRPTELMLSSALSLPQAPELVRNEFFIFAANPDAPVSWFHTRSAQNLLRDNLAVRIKKLKRMLSSDAKEFFWPHGPVSKTALEAIADAYGLGLVGSEVDVPALIRLYDCLAGTALEPLAFTAVARGLLAVGDSNALQQLAGRVPHTQAYDAFVQFSEGKFVLFPKDGPVQEMDFSELKKPLETVSRLGAEVLDFSPDATKKYLLFAARLKVRADSPLSPAESAGEEVLSLKEEPFSAALKLEDLQTPSLTMSPTHLPEGYSVSAVPCGRGMTLLEPSRNVVTHRYPSGLEDEESIIRDWLEYYNNGYFHPRNQIEAIRGMSAAKANNVMELLYYMPIEEAERVILEPIRQTGRLPDFMYTSALTPGTRRLPAGYYKNKFNENVKRFVALAQADGSVYTHNVELKDLATTMEDYSFEQGFSYTNDKTMSAGLRHNWRALVGEIQSSGLRADRSRINALWRAPVKMSNGKTVSLEEYFTQTRRSAFFENGSMPEFFLNSNKWVAWENERRNLAAAEYISRFGAEKISWLDQVQDWFALGRRERYLTLEQFGNVMVDEWHKSFGWTGLPDQASALADDFSAPSSLTVRVNNFDKVGGVCQMAFSDGGYMGKVERNYDGTSVVNRFEPVEFSNVPVVAIDYETMTPRVMTLATVPYVKDLKKPDLEMLRAGTMVGDGLDPTRDLLDVRRAEAVLQYIPHLKATIYPQARLAGRENLPAFLNGGGLGAYLALFTPDFFPLKKIMRWRWVNGKLTRVPEYFVRKEVPALAGSIHRDHLTFTGQIEDRAVDNK